MAAHEAAVTASIHNLYEMALKEKDYAAQVMLQWFITEQVEEEKNAAEIVAQLELVEARGTADHDAGSPPRQARRVDAGPSHPALLKKEGLRTSCAGLLVLPGPEYPPDGPGT